ncbi:hypothetical protein LCGC14_1379000 [marine sediment metagenome]|uniref:Uncharacterized protein n=1 Tax=marine sediment metagenome TaxID=412755 RepID=A0A0F9KP55_9ZZZZ
MTETGRKKSTNGNMGDVTVTRGIPRSTARLAKPGRTVLPQGKNGLDCQSTAQKL